MFGGVLQKFMPFAAYPVEARLLHMAQPGWAWHGWVQGQQ